MGLCKLQVLYSDRRHEQVENNTPCLGPVRRLERRAITRRTEEPACSIRRVGKEPRAAACERVTSVRFHREGCTHFSQDIPHDRRSGRKGLRDLGLGPVLKRRSTGDAVDYRAAHLHWSIARRRGLACDHVSETGLGLVGDEVAVVVAGDWSGGLDGDGDAMVVLVES